MSSKGIILLALLTPAVFAQSPPARNRDDLDVTMHVIVDPDAKVPDEIVRRIPLPKPSQPAPGAKPKGPDAPGREFGQQVSEDAQQRAEEARNNKKPKKPPGKPPSPPGRPPAPGG